MRDMKNRVNVRMHQHKRLRVGPHLLNARLVTTIELTGEEPDLPALKSLLPCKKKKIRVVSQKCLKGLERWLSG